MGTRADAYVAYTYEVIWQVEYTDLVREGTMWWDYPKELNDFIEHTMHEFPNTNMISYVWSWMNKGPVEYELDIVNMTVTNKQTNHTRRVRRVTTQHRAS